VGVSMPPSIAIPAFETKEINPDAARAAREHGHLAQRRIGCWATRDLRTISYTVTKHASIGLTECLAATYVDQGIGVSVLAQRPCGRRSSPARRTRPEGRDARSGRQAVRGRGQTEGLPG
jgi:NAD(P)-dependent dehydrogenase (short-subunit alcohol dehydrogenase family)